MTPADDQPATTAIVRGSPADLLFRRPEQFDFFQAVRVFELLAPDRRPCGRGGLTDAEPVLFRAHQSLSFTVGSVYSVQPGADDAPPGAVVSFMGMTGPNGVLPRHYTETILALERTAAVAERGALREWFDLYNHRFVALFFWSWEKYRPALLFERAARERRAGRTDAADPFSEMLYCFAGLGLPETRRRWTLTPALENLAWSSSVEGSAADETTEESSTGYDAVGSDAPVEYAEEFTSSLLGGRTAADVPPMPARPLLAFAGLLARPGRSAAVVSTILSTWFRTTVVVEEFVGRWLDLRPDQQTRLGGSLAGLGVDALAGRRVW
ncbi:MAG: type VI secretion system baseplate subunit TssG, partial [Planctomycetia bacterium]